MDDIALLLVGAVFVNNFVLVKFLGLCPFMGVSRRLDAAYGMALATGFVLTLSAALAWCVHHWLLAPLGLEHLRNARAPVTDDVHQVAGVGGDPVDMGLQAVAVQLQQLLAVLGVQAGLGLLGLVIQRVLGQP